MSLENLQSSTDNLEETLQNLSSEDLDSQFALVQVRGMSFCIIELMLKV